MKASHFALLELLQARFFAAAYVRHQVAAVLKPAAPRQIAQVWHHPANGRQSLAAIANAWETSKQTTGVRVSRISE